MYKLHFATLMSGSCSGSVLSERQIIFSTCLNLLFQFSKKLVNLFVPNAPSLYLLKPSFLMFSALEEGCFGNKCVKKTSSSSLLTMYKSQLKGRFEKTNSDVEIFISTLISVQMVFPFLLLGCINIVFLIAPSFYDIFLIFHIFLRYASPFFLKLVNVFSTSEIKLRDFLQISLLILSEIRDRFSDDIIGNRS